MIEGLPAPDDRCDMAHNTYGLDMRDDGLWRARCACGWEAAPSPDVAAQAGRLDEHLRTTLPGPSRWQTRDARDDREPGDDRDDREARDELPLLRALDRNLLLGAVALGMAVFGALAAWVDHDVDGV